MNARQLKEAQELVKRMYAHIILEESKLATKPLVEPKVEPVFAPAVEDKETLAMRDTLKALKELYKA
jgi:hypothetical protein